MAKYSNVKLPAFYIPFMDYQQSLGNITYQDDELNDIHLLNPAKTHRITQEDDWWENEQIQYDIDFVNSIEYSNVSDSDGYVYIFILGHNFNTTDCSIDIKFNEADTYTSSESREKIVNDSNSDNELIKMASTELEMLNKQHQQNEKKLK